MSYGRKRLLDPDPYNRAKGYKSDKGYSWEDFPCKICSRVTAWIGAGRRDPNMLICCDCGTECLMEVTQ